MSEYYQQLLDKSREVALLGSCGALLGWDERTFMPVGATEHRGNQMALLARMGHELVTDPIVGELLTEAESQTLSDAQLANVREIRRTYDRATKVPRQLVEELAKVTSQAQSIWQEAKSKNDFPSFQPWLEKIVALKRQEADCVGYQESPYDALVDEFEPGAKASELKKVFAELSAELAPLAPRIMEKLPPVRADLAEREFSVAAQEALCRDVAGAVGFDFQRGRLDTTAHPFCSGIGPGDCRILTRYHLNRPLEAFFGTLHEAGHGLYEQGLPAEAWGTPLGNAASFGIHESQSRLWENQIGRSRAFWSWYYPTFQQDFVALKDVTGEEFWRVVNDVKPSLIRIDADEVTYNLHIILRFELEHDLLTGDLPVADVPVAWNQRVQQFFGLTVPDDTHGCLQDIHWSFGGIGYFPTYTLGNLYAAQFMAKAEADLPKLWDNVRAGKFAELAQWLRENIHRHGQRYRANELCRRVTGQALTSRYFLDYLRAKFLDGAAH